MENRKSIRGILIDMDDAIAETENAEEKVKLQSMQLLDIFLREQTESQKAYSWDTWRVVTEILSDYVEKTERGLKTVRESFNTLWEMEKEKEAPQVKTVILAGADGQQYKDEIAKLLNELDTRGLRNAWLMISAMAGRLR